MTASPDPEHMRRAIALARDGVRTNQGGPFGAVVVRDGAVIGEGQNRVTSCADPTAHAEVVAIRAACHALGTHSLAGCELYASCEPCPMCLAALYWARIDRIWIACTRTDAEAIGFDDEHFYEELALPPKERELPMGHLLRDEGLEAFRDWEAKADKVRY